jgi:predicted dehydrogenase
MEKMKIAILGFGSRGFTYGNIIMENPEEMELVAVCEINPAKKALILHNYHLREDQFFSDYREMLKKGKIADILIISTMDRDHHDQALAALEVGYDLLLEKPIATSRKDCQDILDKANQLKRKIAVCHVLRYTPFYQKLKEIISSGTIGEVVNMSQAENIGYYHYAHSYVRGNWRNEKTSGPIILTKTCHDLDIIRWLIEKECTAISSFGSLNYFKPENAPKGSAEYCYKCSLECPFNALSFYKKNPMWAMIFTLNPDIEAVLRDEKCSYGRCVYHSDNNVCDHQVVNLEFENQATAQLTLTAFSNEIHRNLKIHGTKGEIEGDMEKAEIIIKIFGKTPEVIDVSKLAEDFSGHAGGDKKMLIDFVRHLQAVKTGGVSGSSITGLTDINYSMESHFMAFDAEKSRLHGGKVISR